MLSRRASTRRGLTLLEVLVAVTLVAVIAGMMADFFFRTLRVRDTVSRELERTQIARQVLQRIGEELRGCLGKEDFAFPVEQRLLGTRRSIKFLTTQTARDSQFKFVGEFEDKPPARHDVYLVSYELWVDEGETTEEGDPMVGGLLRTEQRTLNQVIIEEDDPLQVATYLWSHELGYIEFRYFDGVAWSTSWEVAQGAALPQMIQVTVGYDSIKLDEWEDLDLDQYPLDEYPLGPEEPNPDRYSALIRLPGADRFFSSAIQRFGQETSDQLGLEVE